MTRLFGTDGIRGEVGKYPLTKEAVFSVGRALGLWLKQRYPQESRLKILIGKDTRQSGEVLELALLQAAKRAGLEAVRVGICPTPTVAYLTFKLGAHLGIAISASHNPGSDNGIKFFDSKGYKLFPSAEEEIEKIFFNLTNKEEKLSLEPRPIKESSNKVNLYVDFAKKSLNGTSLSNLKIVLDCACGSFSKIAPYVFRQLRANVVVMSDKPDGKNINADCGTMHPESMAKKVITEGADLGIAFDGDGDRVIVADETGKVLDGDYILAIFAKNMLSDKKLAQNTVVCTQMSNIGLELYLEKLGVQMIRTDVGDKYVLEKMLADKFNLGGEQSGHILLLEHTTTGDGLIAALQLIKVMLKKKRLLSELAKDFEKFPQVLVNVQVKEKKPFNQIPGLEKTLKKVQDELDRKGRVLIRYSGTENLARVMIEGKDINQVNRLAGSLAKVFKDALGEK